MFYLFSAYSEILGNQFLRRSRFKVWVKRYRRDMRTPQGGFCKAKIPDYKGLRGVGASYFAKYQRDITQAL